MVPYISEVQHVGPILEQSSPGAVADVSQGDYVFVVGMGRPTAFAPELVTGGASSAWITSYTFATQIYAYRRATADENLSVQLSFPGGDPPIDYDAELYLIVVKGATRIDSDANIITVPGSDITVDGFSLPGSPRPGDSFPAGSTMVALWVMYSQDGFSLALGAIQGQGGFEGHIPAGWAEVAGSLQSVVVSIAGAFVEFPRTFEYKGTAGDSFLTVIDKGGGGGESRRSSRDLARKKWLVSLKTPASFRGNQQQFVDLLMAFFMTSAGKAYPLRVRDPVDFKAENEAPVLISYPTYQLAKRYQIGGRTYVRNIYKPITDAVQDWQGNTFANTVHIYSNGTEVFPPAGYVLDAETGILTAYGPSITASFEFDFPARFDTDELALQVEESFVSGGNIIASVSSLPLIEVLPPEF